MCVCVREREREREISRKWWRLVKIADKNIIEDEEDLVTLVEMWKCFVLSNL